MSGAVGTVLRTLSCKGVRLRSSEEVTSLGRLSTVQVFMGGLSTEICGKRRRIPIELCFPARRTVRTKVMRKGAFPVLLFFRNNK